MNGIKELNKEVDIILANPERFKDFPGFSPSRFRMWRARQKAKKLSLQKKIEITEYFGNIFVVIKLHNRVNMTSEGGETLTNKLHKN